MKRTPLVSVIVSVPAAEGEVAALRAALREQTTPDWELLSAAEGDPGEIRLRLLGEAAGRFALFMRPGDRFASERALETLALWAEAEGAQLCAGEAAPADGAVAPRFARDGWVEAEDFPEGTPLAGVLFRREWLVGQGPAFRSLRGGGDGAFLALALACAGRCWVRAEPCVRTAADPQADGPGLSGPERLIDRLAGMAALARFARERRLAWLHARQYRALFGPLLAPCLQARAAAFPEQRAAIDAWLADLDGAFDAGLAPEAAGRSVREVFLEPLVSVIVPVYNAAATLRRCLLSLKAQTLPNLEVLCVDDGSTDESQRVLAEMQAEMPNLTVLIRPNGGQGAARNAALRAARGRHVGFVDADDWVEPEMFARLAEGLEAHPEADIAECGTACEWDYAVPDREKAGLLAYYRKTLPPGLHPITPAALTTGGPCDKLFRAAFLRAHAIRFPEGVKNEDEAFCFFALCRATHFVLFHERWYHYIRNAQGTMALQTAAAAEGKLPDVFAVLNLLIDFAEAEDRIPHMGRLLKSVIGAVSRFADSPLREEVLRVGAWLLRKAGYPFRMDFIVPEKKRWCASYAKTFLNDLPETPPDLPSLRQWLPAPRPRPPAPAERPRLTFVVPVYNVEAYLSRCIESLRAQTFRAIEILCIDDGSTDESLRILNDYRGRDARIRVIAKPNEGVSATRNLGIQEARGDYIAFVDGDDWVEPTMAEETLPLMERHRLELLAFDYQCFDWQTDAPISHWWMLKNHLGVLPVGRVVALEDFKVFRIYGSTWLYVFDRTFLLSHRLRFPDIALSEDLCFVLRVFANLRRGMVFPKTFYHYRRGNPSSAVSRLSRPLSASSATTDEDGKGAAVQALLAFLESEDYKALSLQGQRLLLERVLSELAFMLSLAPSLAAPLREHCERIDKTWPFLVSGGAASAAFSALVGKLRQLPRRPAGSAQPALPAHARQLLDALRKRRETTPHDLYLVTAFMGPGTEADPRDSWTFFSWLQAHHVPSAYLICKRNRFYGELREKGLLKDVIALDGTGYGDFEILEKGFKALLRAKVIAQEDIPLNPLVAPHLRQLPGLSWVFLQHGVTHVGRKSIPFLRDFDFINVSGQREAAYIAERLPDTSPTPTFIPAGLPRWDAIRDESAGEPEKVVFVMFTWRRDLERSKDFLVQSRYLRQIKTFLSEARVARFRAANVRFVFAPHHRLLTLTKGFRFDLPVEVCRPADVAYWIRHASCCLTDYSSVSFDFLFQNKPVLYWLLDRDDPLLSAETRAELAWADRRMRLLFNVMASAEETEATLLRYAREGFVLEPEKRAVAESFFAHKREICRHLYEGLEAALREREAQTAKGGEA